LCQRKPIHTPPAVRRVHHQHLCRPRPHPSVVTNARVPDEWR
jgi:hypothetical protein